jgi:hypothetical protein
MYMMYKIDNLTILMRKSLMNNNSNSMIHVSFKELSPRSPKDNRLSMVDMATWYEVRTAVGLVLSI